MPCRTLYAMLAIVILGANLGRSDDWPQFRGPHRDATWNEHGLMEKFPSAELPAKWRAPIASGYSGPTVAAGKVYVTDRLDRPQQVERVHCFAEQTGKPVWTFTYDCAYEKVGYVAGPRASVTIHDGLAYAFGTMGHLHCLRADDGQVVWKKDLNAEYHVRMPIWGLATAPLIDGDRLIVQVGGTNACLVAFDRRTGQELWKALDDNASYSAPVLVQQAGQTILVCWTGDSVAGLNPATGKVHWRYPFPPAKMVINIATPVQSGDRLFMTAFYDGALLLKLKPNELAVEKLWRRQGKSERDTDALHSIISNPLFEGDHIYGVDSYGELRCLDAKTGDRIWENLTATPKARWSTIHMVKNGDRVWMFNERGELLITKLSPQGFTEISRTKIINPTTVQLSQRNGVCWAPPAYANKCVFVRNDEELICVSLAAE